MAAARKNEPDLEPETPDLEPDGAELETAEFSSLGRDAKVEYFDRGNGTVAIYETTAETTTRRVVRREDLPEDAL